MNLGAGEILLLAIFALLLFGPNRLPDVARQVGRALAEVRRMSREFEREVREVTEPFEREIRDAAEPIEREVRELEHEARKAYAMDDDYSSFDVDAPAADGANERSADTASEQSHDAANEQSRD